MPDLALVRGYLSPNRGQQPGRGFAARLRRQRGMARAEKSGFPLVRGEPVGRFLDDAQRRLIAALRSRPPGEQAVSAEHHADIFGMIGRHLAELQAEIEAGTLPRQKADLVAVNLLRQLFGVGRGRDRDHRVGVDVIDVARGNKGVQRRIDRGRARIEIEGAMVEQRDHFVFMRDAAIQPLQRLELIEIEGGEAVALHRADVAARALHPEHSLRLLRQWIARLHFRRRVAAAEIGDPEVAAEQVRAVEQLAGLVEARRMRLVPEICEGRQGRPCHECAFLDLRRNG